MWPYLLTYLLLRRGDGDARRPGRRADQRARRSWQDHLANLTLTLTLTLTRTIWLGTHPTAEEAALVVRAVRPNRNPDPHPDPSPEPNLNRNPGPDPGPKPSQVARYRTAHGLAHGLSSTMSSPHGRARAELHQNPAVSKSAPTKAWPNAERRHQRHDSAMTAPRQRPARTMPRGVT